MLILDPPCTAEELAALRAFRRTAQTVHQIYAPLACQRLTVRLGFSGEPPKSDAFPENAFRSLAMAVRQVYLQKDPTHFDMIVRLVERGKGAGVKEFCSAVRENWRFALVSPPGLEIDGRTYSGKDVFETWLYARAVHQKPRLQPDAERLDRMAPLPTWVVQVVVRNLAICILSLDTGAAEVLGEEALPQIDDSPSQERRFRF